MAYFFTAPAYAVAIFTNITFQNGWSSPPGDTRFPGVSVIDGVVHMRGALAGGTAGLAFQVPAADVYAPITLCNAAKGRLYIPTSGVVQIFAATTFPDAQCFTSLDGVEYQLTSNAGTPVATINGWVGQAFGTYPLTVTDNGGVIRFTGAVSGGTTDTIAILPAKFRPLVDVYVPVDLCNGIKGRIVIQPDGSIRVFSTNAFADAQCFTSLEGVSYAL